MGWGGWFFSDYRVSPNFLLCWGWVVVEVGLGCDNFDRILGSLLTFWGPNVLFLGLGKGSETVLGSPHID